MRAHSPCLLVRGTAYILPPVGRSLMGCPRWFLVRVARSHALATIVTRQGPSLVLEAQPLRGWHEISSADARACRYVFVVVARVPL
ncbi:uncharacterized protein CTRU02_214168 [Colletotrichum truncatum]|uniref:Uncharacterized protein n=1 Tax=Colletotrichum truncatum TaxID=5467 RepID=A0ACC3YHS7_COLTU